MQTHDSSSLSMAKDIHRLSGSPHVHRHWAEGHTTALAAVSSTMHVYLRGSRKAHIHLLLGQHVTTRVASLCRDPGGHADLCERVSVYVIRTPKPKASEPQAIGYNFRGGIPPKDL